MDDFDLMFRNETKATERRAQKANKKALTLAQKAEKQDSSINDAFYTSPFSPPASTTSSGNWVVALPAFSIEEQARCHFISHFILMPRDGRTVGHMDFILPLLKQEGPDSHIQHAFNACALTFLSNRRGVGGKVEERALEEYTAALARTNTALQDRKSQQSDASLAAVLLLGMFESISAKQISAFNWGSHIEGAVQLVKARGRKQIKTGVGRQLFIAVRTLMTVYCLTASKAPAMGAEWWLEGTVFSQTAMVIQRLMIKTSEIRAQNTQLMATLTKTPENIELVLEVIRKAKAVDQEVLAWQQKQLASEDWRYKTVAWEDSVLNGDYAKAEVFPGRVDVYNDIWIGAVSNSARTVRLILQAVIVRCTAWVCSPVDYRTTPEYATAASVCRDAITDILASVPYFLGWHLKRKDISEKTNFGTFACGDEDSAKGLAGYLVTWPLTCAISYDYATDAQRAWAMGRLQKIGSDLGVRYAFAMSQLQMRVPSILIHGDALKMSHPAMNPYGFGGPVATHFAGHVPNPQQQWEAAQQVKADVLKTELLKKMTNNATDDGAQRAAQQWFKIRSEGERNGRF
ncbi:hypothetical protein E0Z10_g4765 [Xylaria hypoxylon]|uniref:Negative acting factor n=1 Tax=Xylaria hypoxylon TaxID=37992 RepID=A0A4Z0YJG5_9PEZI|nr:hypothetical protein E0Z10_g4765 [Xylaria hypoxylon]